MHECYVCFEPIHDEWAQDVCEFEHGLLAHVACARAEWREVGDLTMWLVGHEPDSPGLNDIIAWLRGVAHG